MKKRNLLLIVTIVGLSAGSASVRAQMLLDQALSGAMGAGTSLGAASQNVDAGMIIKRLTQQGYTNIHPVSGRPQHYVATAPGGIPVTLTVNGATGQIVSVIPK